MFTLFFVASLNVDFALAGKTSAGLILCEQINNQVSGSKLNEYNRLDSELNSYLNLELEASSDLSYSFFSAQVDYINSFEYADKNKPLDDNLLSKQKCQDHIDNANMLIRKFQ
ncbi:hypothetical protein PUND_a2204 [Pseudoalteromonas undina]|uniref:Uncharacterized protein n=1 Tax=Pseudoalteromonas undina TaxID=43660 RepID=A0ABP2XZ17_9GAMM|nr:hypothetical protein [Pseudoalteromonas undina]KAF7766386.1 hypothetical protein PUND_a2204 [Pseudoalteromonas undina]